MQIVRNDLSLALIIYFDRQIHKWNLVEWSHLQLKSNNFKYISLIPLNWDSYLYLYIFSLGNPFELVKQEFQTNNKTGKMKSYTEKKNHYQTN